MRMKEVKRISGTFIDGDGNKHQLKDAIVIDLTAGKDLTDLLEEAYILSKKGEEMIKSKITLQELGKKRAELTQRWKRVMDKSTEIEVVIAVKRAERKLLDEELGKIEKEYQELVRGFDESRIFQKKVQNAPAKK